MIRRLAIVAFIISLLFGGCILNKKSDQLASASPCPPLNQDRANTTVYYEKNGLAFSIPYNTNWGVPAYKENVPVSLDYGLNGQYVQYKKTIQFGAPSFKYPSSPHACDELLRKYIVVFTAPEEIAYLLETNKSEKSVYMSGAPEGVETVVTNLSASQTTINGVTTIKQLRKREHLKTGKKECPRFAFHIIGLKNNVALTDIGEECATEEELTKIAQTMYFDEPFVAEKRILLTPYNAKLYPDNCAETNQDPPTTKVIYSNPQKGLFFAIPYNEAWGTEKFRISPYDEKPMQLYVTQNDSIYFGRLYTRGEGCAWRREYQIEFIKKDGAEDLIASIKRYPEFAEIHIGDFDVLKTDDTNQAMCGTVIMYVMGERYIYALFVSCGGDTEEDLKRIIETFEKI